MSSNKPASVERRHAAWSDGYEVGYFAFKHRLTIEEALQIMNQVENSREKLDTAAVAFKSRSLPDPF
jgi:hypothetical protein